MVKKVNKSNSKLRGPRKRKTKITLVFDEEKRREFLTGFHKRKLQRKKKAQEKLEHQLKEERKRLKHEAKESYKKLVKSNQPIPGLEHLLEDQYEDEDVRVKIVELSTNDIAKQNNWIGPNVPKCTDDVNTEICNEVEIKEEIPGMELKQKPKVQNKECHQFTSERDVKKVLKKQATKNVQKSKIFQRKNKLERQKQKKKSLHQKKEQAKFHKERTKRRGKNKFE